MPLTLERLIARHIQGAAFGHFFDDFLHHIAVLKPAVAGVQLHVVVARDSGEVHLDTSRARLPGQHQPRISLHAHTPGTVFSYLRVHIASQNVLFFHSLSLHRVIRARMYVCMYACMYLCMYVHEVHVCTSCCFINIADNASS